MTGYELSRAWFNWCFENTHIATPNHTALYMWFVEKWNRCGQKDNISVTTYESMDAIGMKSRNTISKTLKDLVDWGFVKIVVESKNQYSCKVIVLGQNLSSHKDSTVASTRTALDQALTQAQGQHKDSTVASTDTINKQVTEETSKQVNSDSSFSEKEAKTGDSSDTVISVNTLPSSAREKKKKEDSKKAEKYESIFFGEVKSGSPYGDGRLHRLCGEWDRENPGKYPPAFYTDFLIYWTAPLEKGKDKGTELWRTMKTWSLAGRLKTSWDIKKKNYANGEYDPKSRDAGNYLRKISAELNYLHSIDPNRVEYGPSDSGQDGNGASSESANFI